MIKTKETRTEQNIQMTKIDKHNEMKAQKNEEDERVSRDIQKMREKPNSRQKDKEEDDEDGNKKDEN